MARIRIVDLALADDVEIEFGEGLNVLTGETGAGKSIVVGSIALLLGARASTDAIRAGADRALVEGVFAMDGEETLVRREIRRDRAGRCTLDGQLSTVGVLRNLAEGWAQLHGQHEGVRLLQSRYQRELLDDFGAAGDTVQRVERFAARVEGLRAEQQRLAAEEEERLRRLSYLRGQVDEIQSARLDPDEDVALAARAALLRTAFDRARLSGEALAALGEEDATTSNALVSAGKSVAKLSEADPDVTEIGRRLESLRHEIDDVVLELRRYHDDVEHDPGELERVESRRQVIADLVRKHGSPLSAVLEKERVMEAEISSLEQRRRRTKEIEGELDEAWSELVAATEELSQRRENAAHDLGTSVRARLADLGVGDGTFEVRLEREADADGISWRGEKYAWSRTGLEKVEFMIAPNAGEGLHALSRIASGGELSRALLALKAASASVDRTPTLVFDEVDSGIGGVAGHHVASQLRTVAEHHQVIVVTHLAQIAAAADHHLVVEKSGAGERVKTSVREVDGDSRVAEVSRLLGGDPERDVSMEHAQELLEERA